MISNILGRLQAAIGQEETGELEKQAGYKTPTDKVCDEMRNLGLVFADTVAPRLVKVAMQEVAMIKAAGTATGATTNQAPGVQASNWQKISDKIGLQSATKPGEPKKIADPSLGQLPGASNTANPDDTTGKGGSIAPPPQQFSAGQDLKVSV